MISFFIGLLFALIIISAIFSSTETAFLSISKSKLYKIKKSGDKRGALVIKLRIKTEKLLSTILIANNLANNFASSLAALVAIKLLGNAGLGVATFVMTALIIIFGEILPKTIAAFYPIKTAKRFAFFIFFVQILLFPLIKIFTVYSHLVVKLADFFWKSNESQITQEELKTLFELGSRTGILEQTEKDMLNKVFDFSDVRIKSIMQHPSQITMIENSASFDQVLQAFKSSGYSRIPVFLNDFNSVLGIIYYKDLLSFKTNPQEFAVKKILLPVMFVPSSKMAFSLFHQFYKEKQHLAIVVNEHGENCGLITGEDLLCSIFGKVTAEHNIKTTPVEQIKILQKKEFLVPANITLVDLNDYLKINLSSGIYITLAGFLLEHFDRLPLAGEKISIESLHFTVEKVSDRHIDLVRLFVN
ncbi:MAG: CNNM domain-containing protein [Treponemataceae bacterium]